MRMLAIARNCQRFFLNPTTVLKKPNKTLFILLFILFAMAPATLWAHAKLLINSDVPPRFDLDSLKTTEPCGAEPNPATSAAYTGIVSSYPRGTTVRVEWEETIPHNGYFAIDFRDNNGNFINEIQVPDPAGTPLGKHALSYTLPDQVCAPTQSCILRMRQWMGGSFYYSCADVVLFEPDPTAQDNVLNFALSESATANSLSWTNPASLKGVLVLRASQDIFSSLNLNPQNPTVYHVGDNINGACVLFKSESGATQFDDTKFSGDSDYYYGVYAYSNSYVYSSAEMNNLHTAPGSGVGDNSCSNPTPTPSSNGSNDGGGAMTPLFLLFIALLSSVIAIRYRRRPVPSKIRHHTKR